MKNFIAKQIINFSSLPLINGFLRNISKHHCTIFMLHRFDMSAYGSASTAGHNPDFVSECIKALKQKGYNLVHLDQVIEAALAGHIIPNAVVFTIDDGFHDHALAAEHIFIKNQCPVTIFLITDFVDGHYWIAESKVRYIIEQATSNKKLFFDTGHDQICGKNKSEFISNLIWHLKTLPLELAESNIERLATSFEVTLPEQIPDYDKPLSWDDARRLEKSGLVRFGAHSRFHPTLALEDNQTAKDNIFGSVDKLSQEVRHPSKVFCYPTGRRRIDFNSRDQALVKQTNCIADLATNPGYLNLKHLSKQNYVSANRFALPNDPINFKQCINYIELIKSKIRQ